MGKNFQKGKYFIVGCARSGTSLMQQLISSHSYVVGVNETGFFQSVNPLERDARKIVSKIALNESEFQIVFGYFQEVFGERISEKVTPYQIFDAYCEAHRIFFNKPAYVEKTPFHSFFIKGILSEIPNSKIVVMIRDPRAIIASRLVAKKPFSRGKKWHLPKFIQIFLNLSEILFTYQEFEKWYQLKHSRMFFVKYEALLTNPKETMEKVFDFLELPFEPVYENIDPLDMRLEIKKMRKVMNSSYQREKTNKISLKPLERWKRVLTLSQDEFVKKWCVQSDLKLLRNFYPHLFSHGKSFLKEKILEVFLKVDHILFLKKNTK